ncbi:hypothetical protein V2J94_36930 [Streptomyces sp. DSM 41524]|uniref:Uncharacterized protein n=1 Tax=Streptomyces asiaticus subsp. ignotus TaxID=3098222 RepID=A0ABU7Q7P4_9ACTN|nr:hypothetical protein [Streptomyces sp. DSM 41524]
MPAAVYFTDLKSADRSPLTPRSYGMDLLRWWRQPWFFEVEWDRGTREDARDFMLWTKLADKSARVHWRQDFVSVDLRVGQGPGDWESAGSARRVQAQAPQKA